MSLASNTPGIKQQYVEEIELGCGAYNGMLPSDLDSL